MELQMLDHMVYADFNDLQVDDHIINQITKHTAETWQPNRKQVERSRNTGQGKVAEEIVKEYIEKAYKSRIELKSYDEIRNDDYTKHAPFDFLLWETKGADITPIVTSIRRDIAATQDQFVRLSDYTRKLCKSLNVKIAEVKSTRIREGLKTQAGFTGNYSDHYSVKKLATEIKGTDDVFCYPYYKRSETRYDYSINDYCLYVKSEEPSLKEFSGEELRKRVIDLEVEKQCCDVFFRVYIDPNAKKGLVIGWIQRERLLDYSVLFKRMKQINKSERALYFAKKLSETKSMETILDVFKKNNQVYANPYTRSNFYHRNRDCRFLSGIKSEDILVFETEDDAIQHGRYINRCKACF